MGFWSPKHAERRVFKAAGEQIGAMLGMAFAREAAACAELARTTPDGADAAFMSEVKQANKRLKKLQKTCEVKENAG